MTVAMDPPLLRDGLAIAAITRRRVWHLAAGGGLAVSGQKDPLAVLLHDGEALRGFRADGGAMTPAEIERLLPGAGRALEAAWQAAYGDEAEG